jgi:hypothetical protein
MSETDDSRKSRKGLQGDDGHGERLEGDDGHDERSQTKTCCEKASRLSEVLNDEQR